jgi:hypothetical protein
LSGARAQEEVLCRSSALYPTLAGDLLCARIHRVLTIARAHGYRALVLGA